MTMHETPRDFLFESQMTCQKTAIPMADALTMAVMTRRSIQSSKCCVRESRQAIAQTRDLLTRIDTGVFA